MNKISEKMKGYLYVFIAGSLWGTIGIFVALLNNCGVDAFTTAFLRVAFGSLFLVFAVIKINGKSGLIPNKSELVFGLVMGIVCQTLFNIAYTIAINTVGVATGAILLYTSPLFVTIMSFFIFSERLNRLKIIALFVNIIGCILTVTNGNFSALEFSVIGVIMGALAGFLYGLLTIIGKLASNNGCNIVTVSFYSFISSTVFLFFMSRPWITLEGIMSPKIVVIGLLYGIIPTALAYLLYMIGLSKPLEATRVPVIASVETVIAAIIGVTIFAESFGLFKIIGIVLVISSVLLISSSKESDYVNRTIE